VLIKTLTQLANIVRIKSLILQYAIYGRTSVMNIKQVLSLSLIISLNMTLTARAPHVGDRLGPMSEILCNADSDWDIFTCEIIENYRLDNNIGHLAVVQEIFRGSVPDTIQLSITFIGCAMGSPPLKKLVPGSRHLQIPYKIWLPMALWNS